MSLVMKVGDTAPDISIDTNADVTGATALKLRMRRFTTTTVVEKTMTASNPTAGILAYSWIAGDTDTPGTYELRAKVTFASTEIEHFPQDSYLELVILP